MRSAILLVALVLSCTVQPEPVVPPPQPAGCDGACLTLARLECPEGEDTEDGVTCPELCAAERMSDGYDLGCVAALESCDLESCEVQ